VRRIGYWAPIGTLAALVLALWGVWTWRLGIANRDLALALEAERQRNFSDMAYHVEQIQSLLGKGLVTATAPQNMRYMSDVHLHASAAATNFNTLPLPAALQASTGKFLQQTGDFAVSLLRNEAAGREMDGRARTELTRLRKESADLAVQLQTISGQYSRGGFRWNPPLRLSWASLWRRPPVPGKPATGAQSPKSMVAGGWDQVGASMEKLPVMLYDGPFSDGTAKRAPAMTGPPVAQSEAAPRLQAFVPGAAGYRTVGIVEVAGNLPAYSFQLAPATAPAGGNTYTAVADIAKNGGYLVQFMNSRVTGRPAVDLNRARQVGQAYLTSIGYGSMVPTYGQADDGEATIAYAYNDNGVVVYPDQIKVKVALDNGEILGVDARQFLMSHHTRATLQPVITADEAQEKLYPALQVQRRQLALIPNQAGTGEILAWEFLTTFGNETYLVYINANTGAEEQVLQQIQSDGGTFAL
jgi:germination protein YpeB